MAANIENITRPLAEAGRLVRSTADLYEASNVEEYSEVTITLEFTSPGLAREVFDTLYDELDRDHFRLGSLNIRREG